jgi:hypothetical protein
MKKIKSLLVVCVVLAIVFGIGTFINASAADIPITSEQIDQIRSSCVSTKNTLNQLHASDALLRVNMGQIFESISTKLMGGFNGRVINNNLNASELVSASTAFNSVLDNFRADYIVYEEQLSSAIDIDCSKQPVSFYDSVAQARVKRTKVHDDVVELNKYIDSYSIAVTKIEDQYFALKAGQ